MFGRHKIKLFDEITLHFLNIEDFSPRLLDYINNNVHFIWNGDNEIIESDDDITTTKIELKSLIQNKDERQKHGIVAEFFCHLYIRANKFNQHFLFSNLEEKGMKKGFDGLYLNNDEFYIFESKSSLESTTNPTHNANISEGYNDLKKKIEGINTENNPWKNAYNHSVRITLNLNDPISKTLKKLSSEYVREKYAKIKDFNIIPSSTIFLGDNFETIDKNDLKTKLERLVKGYEYKHIDVICINKKSIQQFLNFLDE